MRKITYGGAVSADHYLTGPDEDIGWLRQSDDVQQLIKDSWKGVDAMLMGRRTWEFAARSGMGQAMKGVKTYVFSSSLESVPEGIELVRDDAAGFVRRLKGEEGGDIILMGGGELGTSLIEAGLVDEIGLNIHPVMLGQGTPLFRPITRRIELELIEARAIAQDCVLLRYRVRN